MQDFGILPFFCIPSKMICSLAIWTIFKSFIFRGMDRKALKTFPNSSVKTNFFSMPSNVSFDKLYFYIKSLRPCLHIYVYSGFIIYNN